MCKRRQIKILWPDCVYVCHVQATAKAVLFPYYCCLPVRDPRHLSLKYSRFSEQDSRLQYD